VETEEDCCVGSRSEVLGEQDLLSSTLCQNSLAARCGYTAESTTVRTPDFISPIFPFLHKICGAVNMHSENSLCLLMVRLIRNMYAFRRKKGD
jgi:hypothetical protein